MLVFRVNGHLSHSVLKTSRVPPQRLQKHGLFLTKNPLNPPNLLSADAGPDNRFKNLTLFVKWYGQRPHDQPPESTSIEPFVRPVTLQHVNELFLHLKQVRSVKRVWGRDRLKDAQDVASPDAQRLFGLPKLFVNAHKRAKQLSRGVAQLLRALQRALRLLIAPMGQSGLAQQTLDESGSGP